MSDVLDQEIKYLPGVGPKRAELLKKELDISTFRDLMYYFPYKYIDRTRFYKIRELDLHQPYVQTKGKIRNFNLIGEGRKQRLTAEFYDDTGSIELIWFSGIKYIKQNILPGKEYTVFGKPSAFNGKINIVHPEMESEKTEVIYTGILQSFYNTSGLLKKRYITSRALNKLQYTLAKSTEGKITETLPSFVLDKFHLLDLAKSLKEIHFPENSRILQKATFRLKFEELFYIQMKILLLKIKRQEHFKGFVFSKVGYNFNKFYNNNLPFELTNAQKKVIKEIRHDLGSGRQMNRLLQGDVGSGKTLVALMVSLIAFDNGYQVSLMAPTEILAQQHFQTIKNFLKGIPTFLKATKGLDAKVIENIQHDELINLLKSTRVYCQLSYTESFGMTLLEAMSCGCIPVVTDRDALPEVVGDCGYVVPYGDVDATRKAILKAFKNRDVVKSINRVKMFSKENAKLLINSLLQEVCK